MSIFNKIKNFFFKNLVKFRRFKKFHPVKLALILLIVAVLASQLFVLGSQYKKQNEARARMESLPKIPFLK